MSEATQDEAARRSALRTLAEQGIAKTSARTIAAAAGVNQALVFYHFGSVDELLAAACRYGAEQVVARYRERLAEVGTLAELLAWAGRCTSRRGPRAMWRCSASCSPAPRRTAPQKKILYSKQPVQRTQFFCYSRYDGDVREAKEKYPEADEFPLDEMTIDILQEKMNSGALSSRKITKLYLQRIAAIDKSGYNLRSVIELNPQALEIADAMDAERRNKKIRTKMHGIPVLIKDNINTGDQMQTTAGSLALAGHKAQKDAGSR